MMSFGLSWDFSVRGADLADDFLDDFFDDFFEADLASDFGCSSAIIIGSISGASSILIIFSLCLSKIIIKYFIYSSKFKKLMEKFRTS